MKELVYNVDGYTITETLRYITPQEASDILATKNTKNRRANKNHVKALALNMSNGSWRYNADPIRFDSNGMLIDGQHRLLALIQAQKNLLCKIVSGLDPECIKAIDVEMKSRNLSDLLYMDNVKDANNAAAVVNRYFALSSGLAALSSTKNNGANSTSSLMSTKSTVEQKYDFYYNNQKLFTEAVACARKLYSRYRILQISDIGGLFAFLYLDKHHSYDEVDGFFEQLYTSSKLNCINMLRTRLINDLTSIKKMASSYRQNLIAKAWNYYIKGKDVKVFSYNPTTEGNIEFI